MQVCRVVSELLNCSPRIQLYQVEHNVYAQLLLPFMLSLLYTSLLLYHWQRCFKAAPFSLTPFSEVVSYVCNIVRLFLFWIPFWDSLNDFLRFAYIKVHLSCLNFFGFWQIYNTNDIHKYNIVKDNFNVLKKSLCFIYSFLPPLPLNPRNHWSFNHLYTFAFSRCHIIRI